MTEGRAGRAGPKLERKREDYAPYLDLGRLASNLPQLDDSGKVELDGGQREAVLEWYREHGPLGLLSQTTLLATLHPTWDQPPVEGTLPDDGTSVIVAGPLTPVQRTFTRTSKGWATREAWFHDLASTPRAEWDRASLDIEQPQVLVTRLGRWEPTLATIDEAWGSYFPRVKMAERDKRQYPRPNTLSFWKQSGEPVKRFVEAAHVMKRLLGDLGQGADRRGRARGREVLSALLAPVGVRPEAGAQGAMTMGWEAPSLLATHAMMILLDLTGNSPLRVCRWCGQPFANPKATYCSEDCSNAFRQKKHREKMKREARAREPVVKRRHLDEPSPAGTTTEGS